MKINWSAYKDQIFGTIAEGKTIREAARTVGLNYTTVTHWFHRMDTENEYRQYCLKRGVAERKRNERFTPESQRTEAAREWEKFRDSIKIGDKVKNFYHNESGVVLEKYERFFTIKTEFGYQTSFLYVDYWQFKKDVYKDPRL